MSTNVMTPRADATASTSKRGRINMNVVLIEGRALIALVLIVIIFSLLSPNFLGIDNLLVMTRHVAMNAILAIGMLLVVLNGGIDLSVGSTVGLSGVVAGSLLEGLEIPSFNMFVYPAVWVVIVISLAVGLLVGYINGVLIARFRVAPFIATLGMLYIARGAALLITDGTPFSKLRGTPELGNTGFLEFLKSSPLGLPMPVWAMIVFAVIFSLVLNKTAFGRWLYATGGNEKAAELSGVPVRKYRPASTCCRDSAQPPLASYSPRTCRRQPRPPASSLSSTRSRLLLSEALHCPADEARSEERSSGRLSSGSSLTDLCSLGSPSSGSKLLRERSLLSPSHLISFSNRCRSAAP